MTVSWLVVKDSFFFLRFVTWGGRARTPRSFKKKTSGSSGTCPPAVLPLLPLPLVGPSLRGRSGTQRQERGFPPAVVSNRPRHTFRAPKISHPGLHGIPKSTWGVQWHPPHLCGEANSLPPGLPVQPCTGPSFFFSSYPPIHLVLFWLPPP